jgi:prepilin-type N-terminal cleavage/methylation domain-containing protein/prepilin-type processing-associated H-X9-DG protein
MHAYSIPARSAAERDAGCDTARCRHVPQDLRTGFTILELLTVMGIVSTLAALILPAIGSAREAARNLQCTNQLKQVGLALHNYHDQFGCLPAGWQWEQSRQSAYGWAVPLLSYLEERAVYEQTDRNRLIGDPINATARRTTVAVLLCPSDIIEPRFTLYEENELSGLSIPLVELPTANYMGVFGTLEADDGIPAPPGDGTFLESRPVRFAEFERGLSNTFVIGERTMDRVPSTWLGIDARGEDAACRLVGNAWIAPNCRECDECEFSSRHFGGANFLWGDGRVELVSETIDFLEYRRMARRFQ